MHSTGLGGPAALFRLSDTAAAFPSKTSRFHVASRLVLHDHRAEKAGTFTNTQRLLQFREKAVDPPGEARSETWFMYHLGRRLKAKRLTDDPEKEAVLALADEFLGVEGEA